MSKNKPTPYTIKQTLANLQSCAEQLKDFPVNLDGGPGYVRGILENILQRGIVDKSHDPELLEALRGLVRFVEIGEGARANDFEAITEARAALDKATEKS